MSKNPKKIRVSITNPPYGHRDVTSLARARRYVRDGIAELDEQALTLTFITRRAHDSSGNAAIFDIRDAVDFRPSDARPDLPILQPSLEWLKNRFAGKRNGLGPLRGGIAA